jgi:hypothetical protein
MFSALLHVTHICHTLIMNMDITQGCNAWMWNKDEKYEFLRWMQPIILAKQEVGKT